MVTCIVPANDRNATHKAQGSPRRGHVRHNDGGIHLGRRSQYRTSKLSVGLLSSFLLEMSPLTRQYGSKLLSYLQLLHLFGQSVKQSFSSDSKYQCIDESSGHAVEKHQQVAQLATQSKR
jgi:hypothetical protein